jgi:hypothetical protein
VYDAGVPAPKDGRMEFDADCSVFRLNSDVLSHSVVTEVETIYESLHGWSPLPSKVISF